MALTRTIAAIAILLVSFAAQAEKRVALVIGNGAYTNAPPLANPKHDAEDMAAALRGLGFTVILGTDLDKRAMDGKILQFANALSGADAGVFHYSGHGLQVAGVNYLVPVDAALDTAAALDFQAVRLDLVQRTMEREAKTNILFLDACRNNPFARSLARALGTRSTDIGRGLAPAESGVGTLISFSTQPGNVALDGAGRNSPYSGPLARALGTQGEDILSVLTAVRNEVLAATNERQVPWENHALRAKFYFNPAASAPAKPQPPSEAAEAWRAVEHSDSEAVLEEFARRFPDSAFAGFAKARLQELRAARQAMNVPKSDPIKIKPQVAVVTPPKPVEESAKPVEAPKPAPASRYEDAGQRLVRTFVGDASPVRSVAISPDGRFALSGGCDRIGFCNGSIKLWDVATGKELRSYSAHANIVTSVAFSPDGRFALSGSFDKTLKLWELTTGNELRSFSGHRDAVRSVAFSPDGRFALSGSDDSTLKLWDIATGKELRSFVGHTGVVHSVAFSPDGRMALSGGTDKTLKLWDIATGKELRTFRGHTWTVDSVAISPDGRVALSDCGNDNTLKLWDIPAGKLLRSFSVQKLSGSSSFASAAFSPDGRYIVTGDCAERQHGVCEQGSIKLWLTSTGKELHEIAARMSPTSVRFSPDGRFVLSGDFDNHNMKLWDISEWTQPREARR